MSTSVFELSGVTRKHGATIALDALSLSLNEGEVLGLIGPNGAGKSTLMRVLLGLIPVQAGEVRVFGCDPWKDPMSVRSRTGYASDGGDDGSRATICELERLHRAVYPRWDSAFAQRLLGPLAKKPEARIDRLSKGEAQRVRIACAMAHRPDLLLLDEPGAGLDPSLRREFLEDAVGLLSENDTTIVISSHHLSDVERIANRIVLVSNGRLLLNTELDALYEGHCLATFEHRSAPVEVTSEQSAGAEPSSLLQSIPHYVGHRLRNGEVKVVLRCDVDTAKQTLSHLNIAAHVARTNLEDLYVVLVGGNHDNA
jgi:ABC-2 type transport system ATP-binding protein